MQALIRQWRLYTDKERGQYVLEFWGAVTLSSFMLLLAMTFAGSPSMTVFARMGGATMARLLALTSLVFALIAPAIVPLRLRLSTWQKQRAYAFLALPLLFYAVSVFLFARDTGSFGASVILFGMFYNLLSLAGAAVYRDA